MKGRAAGALRDQAVLSLAPFHDHQREEKQTDGKRYDERNLNGFERFQQADQSGQSRSWILFGLIGMIGRRTMAVTQVFKTN